MPLTVSPIKKAIVKRALKQGKSARQALRECNYSEGHIRRSTKNKIVRDSMNEIMEELKAKDVTVDLVIRRLNEDRELALSKKDYATATRVDELLGKYLAMFTDRQQTEVNITEQEQAILNRYMNIDTSPIV